jgi:ankyrin repeat protein
MRVISASILVLVTAAVGAQTQSQPDGFYHAVRQNDLATLRALARDEGVNASDAQGQTPVMLAAAFGSVDAVSLLITAGADVKASNGAGLTALHLAADDAAKTRLLLDAGANVDAVSQAGRTPLLVAASASTGADVVRQLVAKGADVNVADTSGVTPLIAAANADNREVVDLLLARGADVHARARTGQPSTPLMAAAVNGNIALVRTLLSRKPDLTVVSADRTGTVKNGPVRYGTVSALHAAVTGGSPDVIELLAKAGAPVDPMDARGMTPLMWAVATDRADPRIVHLLLAHHADSGLRSPTGESAIDWARKFNQPAVLAALGVPAPPLPPTADNASSSRVTTSPREAVLRSLPLQRTASSRVMTDGGCSACHAQPLAAMAIDAARARGWTTMSSDEQSAQVPMGLNAFATLLMQLPDQGGLPDGLIYSALQMADRKSPPTRATDVLVRYLAAKQRAAGNWRGVGATRAPMQDGDFSRTAMSIRALTVYATPARAPEYRNRAARAADWLAAQTPLTTEDRVMQLLGLHWADAHASTRDRRVNELLKLQRADGGWAQTRYLASDAYATGQVLYTLCELAVPMSNAAIRRGVAFLVSAQHEDGSWYVKSRAMKIQPYFESGFPYGHDQWISHAGTAWATIGLARAAEEDRSSPVRASAADPFVGTYVFNPAKSTMSGAPATAELILTISEEGDHLVVVPSGKTTDGVPLTGKLTPPKAGGTVPAPQGTVAYDSTIVTRINPHTIQIVTMRQSRELARIRLELTPDGKTLTRSIRSTNAQGQPIEGVSVLERQ